MIVGPKTCGGSCADLPRSSGITFSSQNRNPTIFVNHSHISFKNKLKKNENQTFRASLKPQGPRDRACVKERKILFRIALTRALCDQMAPVIPILRSRKTQKFLKFFFLRFGPFRNTERIKGKSQLVPFIFRLYTRSDLTISPLLSAGWPWILGQRTKGPPPSIALLRETIM